MFSTVSNASKAAFITLTKELFQRGFGLIDWQVNSSHLTSLGARDIPREEFTVLLCPLLGFETIRGNWGFSPVRRMHLIPTDLPRWFGCVVNYTLPIVFYTLCPSKNVILWP